MQRVLAYKPLSAAQEYATDAAGKAQATAGGVFGKAKDAAGTAQVRASDALFCISCCLAANSAELVLGCRAACILQSLQAFSHSLDAVEGCCVVGV